ncbi:MAG: glycosyltransferase family 9 protein [Candidatus Nanoarchaeia archaeon]|nr:glycosyltransferase family 9 protein [Candidatus Nanoarchaeia archaeon]
MQFKWNKNCKEFTAYGGFACDLIKTEGYKSCEECKFYDPYSEKILIIKLGAIGDVIRTTPILTALRRKYENPQIIWLVKEESIDALKNNYLIDKIYIYNQETLLKLKYEKFDILYSLETDMPGTAIANEIKADKKYGFYLDEFGQPSAFNKEAEFIIEKALSDYLNKNNRKTYQQYIFEASHLPFTNEEPILNLSEHQRFFASEFLHKNNLRKEDKILGIHIGGGGKRWPSKVWHKDEVLKFIRLLKDKYKVIIFSSTQEKEIQKELINNPEIKNYVYPNNPENSLGEFIAVANLCETIVTGDSMALHVSTALKKKTIALFFCTPDWEIETYGRVKKLVSPLLMKYFFTDQYHEDLVKSITAEQVYSKLEQ